MLNKKNKNEEVDIVSTTNTTGPKVTLVHGIAPLELNVNFGREDLNEAFKKVEDKINELINK